ncbi:MAG: T9SS type A sorting domain-containing protein [Flavobacteriales bacterium]
MPIFIRLAFVSFFSLFISTTALAQEPFIYVSDVGDFQNGPWQILKYSGDGEFVGVFTTENLGWPQDILFLDEDSTVLIPNISTGRINTYNAQTGAWVGTFASGLSDPTRIVIGPDSLLYVLQWAGSNQVLRYELDGTFVDVFTNTGVNASIGIDWNSKGFLFVSSYYDAKVDCFDTAGNYVSTFVDSALAGPTNIWFDEEDVLHVLDFDGDAVKRFDTAGNYIDTWITGLDQCEGFAFMEDGSLLIGNGGTGSVKRYDSAGNYLSDLVMPGTGGLIRPNAVVIHMEIPMDTTDSSTAVGSLSSKNNVSVYPTAGRQFYCKEPVKEVRVYSANAQVVYTGESPSSLVWDASQMPSGAYIIELRLSDGVIKRQKVLVK